jgi:hypothetical protein
MYKWAQQAKNSMKAQFSKSRILIEFQISPFYLSPSPVSKVSIHFRRKRDAAERELDTLFDGI